MKRAIYAGSFDLPTIGHEWVVKTASNTFDELIIAVGRNPYKKYMFNHTHERISMMKKICNKFKNVKVMNMDKSYYVPQYLIPFAIQNDCQVIVRGLRSLKDFYEEIDLRDFNDKMPSWYLIAPSKYRIVSSSFVKGLIGYDGWEETIKKYIPDEIYTEIIQQIKSPIILD
jgi:pantetheine-phosphate adenylyltransferase